MAEELPFRGVRVIELARFWSGPFCTCLLAAFGAEVIKVESPRSMDEYRTAARPLGDYTSWETSPLWNVTNLNKLGCTLDLKHPKGVELFKALVAKSDVVVENFSPHVMDSLGLSYEVLKAVRPDIIYVSLPAYSKASSWRDVVGFAFTFEHLSGVSDATGYSPEDIPYPLGGAADPTVGYFTAAVVAMALMRRRRTGEGAYIEGPQSQIMTYVNGRRLIEWQVCGQVAPRMANRHPLLAPHNCYPCREPDTWITIAVETDEQWQALVEVMGAPEWARDPALATVMGRKEREAELDARLGQWTRGHDHRELMHRLQAAGVPAGAVMRATDIMDDPHYRERQFLQPVDREVVGEHAYPWFGFRIQGLPNRHHRPAPLFGQHNDYVFRELLGLTQAQLEELAQEGVIGWAPA